MILALSLGLLGAVIYGCTKERSTDPWGGGDGSTEYSCTGCHANLDFLEDALGDEPGKLVRTRSDG